MQENNGFTFLGVTVCQRAFQILTGIPAGTIQQARDAARSNAVTALTRKELGMWATIRNSAKAPRYLDARSWLEVHAEKYAEANPMTGQMVLPFGRKSDYYHMYCWERSQEVLSHLDGEYASQQTFLQAWRCEPQFLLAPSCSTGCACLFVYLVMDTSHAVAPIFHVPLMISLPQECFHVVIASRTSMFVACQVCKFLQGMIASTSRQHSEVLDALKLRLGRHYAFQASQRLADERLMEQARRSDNAEW